MKCMKITTPELLAIDLLDRSICRVEVSAVLSDASGIYSWGWNFQGLDGLGCHAEIHAIMRANRKRLNGSTITIAGRRRKSGNAVCSLPCMECMSAIVRNHIHRIEYRDKNGDWYAV